MLNRRALAFALLGLTVGLASPGFAQEYPTKPIRLIVPFPPGGSNDVVGRMVAQQLGERLGQQVVVDNRAGAGGTIGTDAASQAAPDGYTLLAISLAHAVNPWLYKTRYDSIKSFAPVAIFATGPNVLVVHPELPVTSVQDLLKLAKERPGKLLYATAGVGSFQHLGAELFKLMAKIDTVHVPYKGGGPAMVDLMGGHVHYQLGSLIQTTPHIRSGKLKALATGGAKRNPILPDLPTVSEAGVPGYESNNWWGIVAPAGTPRAVVDRLNKEVSAALNSDQLKKAFAAEGATIVQMTPDEFGTFIAEETAKWGRVVKEANIKLE
jgi:tripartite-type tricarboxylate transporter receptor subunit TctC